MLVRSKKPLDSSTKLIFLIFLKSTGAPSVFVTSVDLYFYFMIAVIENTNAVKSLATPLKGLKK